MPSLSLLVHLLLTLARVFGWLLYLLALASAGWFGWLADWLIGWLFVAFSCVSAFCSVDDLSIGLSLRDVMQEQCHGRHLDCKRFVVMLLDPETSHGGTALFNQRVSTSLLWKATAKIFVLPAHWTENPGRSAAECSAEPSDTATVVLLQFWLAAKMVKKKIDARVRGLLQSGVNNGHRSFIILVGDKGRDQVVNLHYILSKLQVKKRPDVLWCYKKELGFSTHRKKRMKQVKKLIKRGLYDPDKDNPFDVFISSTNIRYCYYKETHNILGRTFGMCVLQDFEALSPNILCRTIETVEGGGLVVLLLNTMKSLKQLYTMTMDVHSRFRTEAHQDVVPRFNERFILSLASCDSTLVLDDELNVLPISLRARSVGKLNNEAEREAVAAKLASIKQDFQDVQPVGTLVDMCKTQDQARLVVTCVDAVAEKSLRSTAIITASRGRGKSAALGLCIAAAVSHGYSNIFVTSPSPENLGTLFEFLLKGLDKLAYETFISLRLSVLPPSVSDILAHLCAGMSITRTTMSCRAQTPILTKPLCE